jgi:hypothetical protein
MTCPGSGLAYSIAYPGHKLMLPLLREFREVTFVTDMHRDCLEALDAGVGMDHA